MLLSHIVVGCGCVFLVLARYGIGMSIHKIVLWFLNDVGDFVERCFSICGGFVLCKRLFGGLFVVHSIMSVSIN